MSQSEPDVHTMTEEQLAEYYYQHRDELAGDELPSRRPERLDVMVSARFTAEEAATIREAAEQRGMSLSAFLRSAALLAAGGPGFDLSEVSADLLVVLERATHAVGAIRPLLERRPAA
jgi:hypothetical protein